ncbi:MAG TPA: FAD-dependent monooxygenase, partial [Kofleriaceae bacterium]
MQTVLISGASIAGLTAARLLSRLGYRVTVVEVANEPRVGGTAVDLRPASLEVARRLGLLEQLEASKLGLERIEFKDANDATVGSMPAGSGDLEIERSRLVHILYAKLDVDFRFGDSITALAEHPDRIDVTFKRGAPQSFDLVIGADGTHSVVRRLHFGDEASYVHF